METIIPLLEKTSASSHLVANLSDEKKANLLNSLADLLQENQREILAENEKDLARMDDADPRKDRLMLNESRLQNLASSVREVAVLPVQSGKVLLDLTLPNGLKLKKLAVPLGVVGVIYESRPNVTIDIASLGLRSGNAVVLRGGSDAEYSNKVLVSLIHQALANEGLPTDVVNLLPTDRKFVQQLLTATRFVDVIIPRGSESLIQYVRQHSLVPTIETGAGVVHIYVHHSADLDKAAAIVVNAKVSRPSVCNALDCLLVDQAVAAPLFAKIVSELEKYQVGVYADSASRSMFEQLKYPLIYHAREEDFGKEWLSLNMTVKVVQHVNEALEHIARFSSRHSEAIVASEQTVIDQFLQTVDAAAVYANASTRFTDGGEFGLGAEIGISTQKLHARGPFALEKLVTEKWVVIGEGQVRW